MLKLKRVEIQGFKSFCDRTELRFNGGGIAAVVGPNGCGKSNLSDAISWVLGEQSAKSLRGARMEDVIFAGTRDRKPVGMAAVTMTLVDPGAEAGVYRDVPADTANSDTTAPGKPSEVTITRRLFRSGESEYLIDGRQARLRDIQDIFMGTGLGPESYAIIEQGRIGQILSSKPYDRRAVIEEAAGITKYKTRKRLAEAKLEGAKQNLTRVFDILEEVTRQLNSLKRQAAKAKRYGELKEEMDSRLRVVLAGRFHTLEREAAKAALDLNAATAELRALSESVASSEQEHARMQAACYETEARLTEARKRLAELNVEVERTRGRLEYQAKQSAAIEQRIGQGETETQQLEAQLTQLEAELGQHKLTVAELDALTISARQRSIEKNETREVLQGRLREREKSLEAGRVAVLRLLGEASTLKNQLAQIDEYLAGIDRETARVTREEQQAAADLERLSASKEDVSAALAKRQLELESIQERRRRADEELGIRKRSAADARQVLEGLRTEAGRLKARRDSLEEILSHRAYTTDSVKRLFESIQKHDRPDFKPLGVLADFVEVDPAYEKAAEEFLHDELEYVVARNWEEAERGIDLMRADIEGRATFLVHPGGGSPDAVAAVAAEAPAPAIGPETGIVARLSDCLRLVNGLRDRAQDLLPRLGRCFIAEDRAAAQRLASHYPHLYFLLPDGICYHGYALSGGKKRGSGPLALKRELRELVVTSQAKQRELDERTRLLENLNHEIGLLEEELEQLRSSQQTQEKDALALDHERRKLAEELARANSRLSVARLELGRLSQETDRTLEQKVRSARGVEEKEKARQEQEEALEAARQNLEDLEAEFTRAQEEHAVLRVELAALEERHRSERTAMSRLESQWKDRSARREEIGREVERLGIERSRLLADNIALDARSAELAEQVLSVDAQVNRLAAEETGMRASLASGEESLRALRGQVDEARERRSQIEVELVKRQAELKFLDETSRKELNLPIEELARAAGDSPEAATLDEAGLADAERQYQEIKAKIEAMGPVNPQALEEFHEAQQRYDFLNAQRQDLLDSIRDTEKAIHEIDTVSRQKFAEAFEAINANFRQSFQTLFGGGIGEMRLTDDVNQADSGIDIVASPPGKKLQNVLLLSGGEKALTALSLLMAIFRYQPSPFCILDEVDAPLDEPNIERLTRLLKEMSLETQFILITHSKKTMEAAQAMYGVTMQEPGVSKLVSVKFSPMMPPPVDRPKAQLAR
ncbi:MAG TPA: chromosome segregation protein SMC [Bryobacteraceae bacterium]|nr:chromosome segregation protein SMC [Bryobacteraceae bacterium]